MTFKKFVLVAGVGFLGFAFTVSMILAPEIAEFLHIDVGCARALGIVAFGVPFFPLFSAMVNPRRLVIGSMK